MTGMQKLVGYASYMLSFFIMGVCVWLSPAYAPAVFFLLMASTSLAHSFVYSGHQRTLHMVLAVIFFISSIRAF